MELKEIITYPEEESEKDSERLGKRDRLLRRTDRLQRRAERRRLQILQAAMRVFDSKGYERATTKEIAAEADVSEGVLYYYFESKRDLLIQLARAYNESIISEIEGLLEGDTYEFVRNILLGAFSDFESRQQFFRAVMQEVERDHELWHEYHDTVLARIIHYLEERLQRAVEEGVFRPMHTGIVARGMIALIKGLTAFKLGDDPDLADIPTEQFVEEITSMLLDGLRRHDGTGENSTPVGLTKTA